MHLYDVTLLLIFIHSILARMTEPIDYGQEDRGPPDRGLGQLEGRGLQDPELWGPFSVYGGILAEGETRTPVQSEARTSHPCLAVVVCC